MASVLGYPSTVWTVPSTRAGYPWIPIIAPFIGSCLGAWLYDVFGENPPISGSAMKECMLTEC